MSCICLPHFSHSDTFEHLMIRVQNHVWTVLTWFCPSETLIKMSFRTISSGELMFRGSNAIYHTIVPTITNVTHLTLLPYSKIESGEFLSFLASNNATLRNVTMKGVTRHGRFRKGEAVHLPLLERLVVENEIVDRDASYYKEHNEVHADLYMSILPFLNKTECHPNPELEYSKPLLSYLWDQGVDITYRTQGQLLIQFNHTRGLLKSTVRDINHKILERATLPVNILALQSVYCNTIPSINGANVTKIIFDEALFNEELGAAMAIFPKLEEIVLVVRIDLKTFWRMYPCFREL